MSTPVPFNLIGVLHLLPLPGGPTPGPGLEGVVERALADARTLASGGIRSAILENLGDAPFTPAQVQPHVIACLAVIGHRVRAELGPDFQLGINVLRNDVEGALGCALACGASFVRANVLSGSTWTDQGLIEGHAHQVLRYRRSLGLDPRELPAGRGVRVAADVFVKHGSPAGTRTLSEVARDTAGRGGADVLIVTGTGTGAACDHETVQTVLNAAGRTPVWLGSGVTPESLGSWVGRAQGAIVGTYLHEGSCLDAPLDQSRVRSLVAALDDARATHS